MSTAIAGKKLSTKRAEWDVRRRARQSKAHPDCRSTTIKSRVPKISLALSSGRDNHPLAATAEMAILIVAVFPSRLSRDTSSEIIHSLLPVYLVTVLGTSMLTVGLIEGIAEATASITKIFSGALSDWMGKRKLLTVIGYGLAAFTKPIFPLAASVNWLVAARFIDRIGKGIRGAPRDALVADLAPEHLRGSSFGLRQSLDTVGAFVGPALAIGLMWLTANNFQAAFWVAVIPAFLAVGLLIFAVHEPGRSAGPRKVRSPFSLVELKRLGLAYWWVVGIAVVFSIARFSEAFLILRAQAVGLPVMLAPLVLVLMNVVYAFAAYPAGTLSDHVNRITILGAGFVLLLAADLVLAFTTGLAGVAAGVALWGLHMGLTQGLTQG